MNLEPTCYHQNLQWSKKYKKELFTSLDVIIFLAEVNHGVVGEAHCSKLDFRDFCNEEDFPGIKKLLPRYESNETCYQNAFGVLPGYRGRGIGRLLKEATIHEAKKQGFRFLLGHAREGAAIGINKKFGARIIRPYEDFGGTGTTHYLYEIDLKKVK